MAKATTTKTTRWTNSLRAKAWWVLRKNKAMTVQDIQNSICNGTEKYPESNLRRWLHKLVAVGILETQLIDDGILTSNGTKLYKLKKDVGPKVPILREPGVVFDPNSGKIINPKSTETVDYTGYGEPTDVAINRL